MNKIVNGVANDYEFPMWYYESNIKTSRDKDSVTVMTYVNQEKEIERLNNIINELEEEISRHIALCTDVTLNDILDKLKELKENKYEI